MKKRTTILYVLMFLPLAAVLISLQFLPEQIPAHYDFDGQVTRWGSKYETLIFPAFTVLMGYFMLGMAKLSAKQEKSGENNEKVCILAGIASLLVFNAMTGYFLYADFNGTENLAELAPDVNRIVFGVFGICMIALGNVMPKLRMNSLIGLRTKWSMKNEAVWKKSQRFGGISFIAGGIILVVLSFLTDGLSCALWSVGILAVLVAACVFYSYKASKASGEETENV